jgi:hypothetical protein
MMIRTAFATLAMVMGLLVMGSTWQAAEARVPCPPGYDGRSGQCLPNRNPSVHYGGNHGGYHRYGGVACPRGYDSHRGQCIPNRNDGGYVRQHHYQGYDYHPRPRSSARCPRGYDAYQGECIPNRLH